MKRKRSSLNTLVILVKGTGKQDPFTCRCKLRDCQRRCQKSEVWTSALSEHVRDLLDSQPVSLPVVSKAGFRQQQSRLLQQVVSSAMQIRLHRRLTCSVIVTHRWRASSGSADEFITCEKTICSDIRLPPCVCGNHQKKILSHQNSFYQLSQGSGKSHHPLHHFRN